MKNIEKKISDQWVQLNLTIEKEDYQEKVEKALKNARNTVTLKGFRTGKVPKGVIRKMYGKAILSEEVGKIVDEAINQHITEKKYKLIGQPIPADDSPSIDFDTQEEFQFNFEIGISPEIKIDFTDDLEYDYYKIISDDKKINEYTEDLQKQNGETLEGDKVKTGDVIIGTMTEIDADKAEKESGTNRDATIIFDKIKDSKTQKAFKGKKVGDTIVFNPLIATDSKSETAILLGLTEEEIGETTPDYNFEITKINRIKPAKMNEDFFKKVFPDKEIKDEKEFKAELWDQFSKYYDNESDAFFARQVLDDMMDKVSIELPKEFLMKYYLYNDKQLNKEQLEKDWENIEESLKNQLLFNEITEKLGINVTHEDLRSHIANAVQGMYGIGANSEMQSIIDNIVENVLKDENEYKRVYDEVFDLKIRNAVKEKVKRNEKEISYQEYQEIAKKYQEENKK
jgi:trigger factor